MSGEQYALPEAVALLREVRRRTCDGHVRTISTADPLNLTGIVTAGERVRAAIGNRLAYRDGVPIGVMEQNGLRALVQLDAAESAMLARTLARRRVPAWHVRSAERRDGPRTAASQAPTTK
jgi:ATP-dependent Lhr-like helicase